MRASAEEVAFRARKKTGLDITPDVVRAVREAERATERAIHEAKKAETARPKNKESVYVRCMCGCGKVFEHKGNRAKFHPDCRSRVYRDPGLMALCKGRKPDIVSRVGCPGVGGEKCRRQKRKSRSQRACTPQSNEEKSVGCAAGSGPGVA